jgi:hypothetical protein
MRAEPSPTPGRPIRSSSSPAAYRSIGRCPSPAGRSIFFGMAFLESSGAGRVVAASTSDDNRPAPLTACETTKKGRSRVDRRPPGRRRGPPSGRSNLARLRDASLRCAADLPTPASAPQHGLRRSGRRLAAVLSAHAGGRLGSQPLAASIASRERGAEPANRVHGASAGGRNLE